MITEINDYGVIFKRPLDENETEQLMVLLEAFGVFQEREAKYHSLWMQYGATDSYQHVRSKAARTQFYLEGHEDESDPIDLINYTVFLIRNMRAGRIHNTTEAPNWLLLLPDEELGLLHHSARMLVAYPGISEPEKKRYSDIADLLWAEQTRRSVG